MPIWERSGKAYYTSEQFEMARYHTSALEYARSQGYELLKTGQGYYIMKEHDSMVFTQNGQWFWNSHSMQGGAIEFITQYEHKSFIEAVLVLAGERTSEHSPYVATYQKPNTDIEKKPFVLPEKADNYKRLFAYLCSERKLDKDIVSKLVKEHKLMQSKDHGNVLFVSYDKEGIVRNALQRGTLSFAEKAFKRDVAGSDKSYPFHIAGKEETSMVAVFEAPIDAISHATILKLRGEEDPMHRISLGGVGGLALERFLRENPKVNEILFCLDNDEAGKAAVIKLTERFKEFEGKTYRIYVQPPIAKDFNEDLKRYTLDLAKTPQQERKNQDEYAR